MSPPVVRLEHVRDAAPRVATVARRTPLEPSAALGAATGTPVWLKLECLQETGSFKVRGAANLLLGLDPEARARGVVTVSTGNHGRAVSFVARSLGVPAVVCLSRRVPEHKVAAVRAAGAELVVAGDSQDEAEHHAERLASERGLTLVPPFDHPAVVAGQGTIGIELADGLPDLGTVLVPLSGGGLIAGVAAAVKGLLPRARVVGVSMAAGAVMHASLEAGRPVTLPEAPTLADSLQGGIGRHNRLTFAMVRALVDEVALVDEAAIAEAMAFVFAEHGLVLEGAGAVAVAALRSGAVRPRGPTVCLLSGRNVDPHAFVAAVTPYLPATVPATA